MQYYLKAINSSVRHGFYLDQAMIYEHYAYFYQDMEGGTTFKYWLTKALESYKNIGILLKYNQLKDKYNIQDVNLHKLLTSKNIEVSSFKKFSKTLTKETGIDHFLNEIIDICLEYTKASRACFILNIDDILKIGSDSANNKNLVKELDECSDLPKSVIYYVKRVKKIELLNTEYEIVERFSTDEYIKRSSPKSILCMPCLNNMELNGILYLESTSGNTFTNEALNFLETLLIQVSVIMNNNKLRSDSEAIMKTKTKELQEAYDKLKKLKEQQDGDYFLTSLLLEPFIQDLYSNNDVSIESFISQKKKFKFRKWEKEIGGDLYLSYKISIHNQEYVCFLNADAMGKSTQGAGGALVFSILFKSIIRRSKNYNIVGISVKDWLVNVLCELHEIFLSFEGSMSMSFVLGLINEKSGKLIYINTEHPAVTLYRDQKASFIDVTPKLKRIGNPFMKFDGNIFHEIQLRPNDIIFIGSDGKDDLELESKDGSYTVNSDPHVFLNTVEESKGDLNILVHILSTIGRFIDDISILKVSYRCK